MAVTINETSVDKEARILEEIKLVEGSNLWALVMRRMRKDSMGMFGFYLVGGLVLMAIIAFIIQQYDALFGLANPTGDLWDQNNYYIELWIPGTQKYLRVIAHPKYIIPGDQSLAPCLQYHG